MVELPIPRLSVVIPSRDTAEVTLACLASISHQVAAEGEILVVDDASQDGTGSEIRERFPEVRLLRNRRAQGFTRSANLGLGASRGEILLLLNSDTEVEAGGLDALLRAFDREPEVGIMGGSLHYPGGESQWSGGREPGLRWLFALASGLPAFLATLPGFRRLKPVAGTGAVDWVTGAALALRRQVLEETGPLDESYAFYCQDLDLCLRARDKGWAVAVCPDFRVLHHHGATLAQALAAGSLDTDPEAEATGEASAVSGFQSAGLLWSDLVLWATKRKGAAWGRRAARALSLGARSRLALRRAVGAFLFGARAGPWRKQTRALSVEISRAFPASDSTDSGNSDREPDSRI